MGQAARAPEGAEQPCSLDTWKKPGPWLSSAHLEEGVTISIGQVGNENSLSALLKVTQPESVEDLNWGLCSPSSTALPPWYQEKQGEPFLALGGDSALWLWGAPQPLCADLEVAGTSGKGRQWSRGSCRQSMWSFCSGAEG